MSDTDSIDSQDFPDTAARAPILSTARDLPADFPLSAESLVRASFNNSLERTLRGTRQILQNLELSDDATISNDLSDSFTTTRTENHPTLGAVSFLRYHAPRSAPQPEHMEEPKGPKQPITTITTALPLTPYKDEDDNSAKSLEYIKVQRTVLKYLVKKPADGLSARQASLWTEQIDPEQKQPRVADALRLCYYMRSQGFDAYAKVEKDEHIALYIVNQKYNERNGNIDSLYWRQHVATGVVDFKASEGRGSGRRNALGGLDPYTLEPFLDDDRGNRSAAPAPVSEPAMSEDTAASGSLDVSIRAAESVLERELSRNAQNPDAIEVALLNIQELRQQQQQPQT